jgi:hypothetical protein
LVRGLFKNNNKNIMTIINAAIVGCDISKDYFQDLGMNKLEKFNWKKVFVTGDSCRTISSSFPFSEFVTTVDSIVNDADISLVFVSADHLEFANRLISSGKAVRIV